MWSLDFPRAPAPVKTTMWFASWPNQLLSDSKIDQSWYSWIQIVPNSYRLHHYFCSMKKHNIDNILRSLSHGLDAHMHGKWARISCQHILHLNLADLLSRKTSFSRIASIRTNDGSPTFARAKEVASAKWHSFCSWLNLPMAAKSLKTPFINSRERVVASNQNKFSSHRLIHLLDHTIDILSISNPCEPKPWKWPKPHLEELQIPQWWGGLDHMPTAVRNLIII